MAKLYFGKGLKGGNMFNAIRSAKGTSQLVWLAGGKGFVYTESQPTGVHSSLAVRSCSSCPSRTRTVSVL